MECNRSRGTPMQVDTIFIPAAFTSAASPETFTTTWAAPSAPTSVPLSAGASFGDTLASSLASSGAGSDMSSPRWAESQDQEVKLEGTPDAKPSNLKSLNLKSVNLKSSNLKSVDFKSGSAAKSGDEPPGYINPGTVVSVSIAAPTPSLLGAPLLPTFEKWGFSAPATNLGEASSNLQPLAEQSSANPASVITPPNKAFDVLAGTPGSVQQSAQPSAQVSAAIGQATSDAPSLPSLSAASLSIGSLSFPNPAAQPLAAIGQSPNPSSATTRALEVPTHADSSTAPSTETVLPTETLLEDPISNGVTAGKIVFSLDESANIASALLKPEALVPATPVMALLATSLKTSLTSPLSQSASSSLPDGSSEQADATSAPSPDPAIFADPASNLRPLASSASAVDPVSQSPVPQFTISDNDQAPVAALPTAMQLAAPQSDEPKVNSVSVESNDDFWSLTSDFVTAGFAGSNISNSNLAARLLTTSNLATSKPDPSNLSSVESIGGMNDAAGDGKQSAQPSSVVASQTASQTTAADKKSIAAMQANASPLSGASSSGASSNGTAGSATAASITSSPTGAELGASGRDPSTVLTAPAAPATADSASTISDSAPSLPAPHQMLDSAPVPPTAAPAGTSIAWAGTSVVGSAADLQMSGQMHMGVRTDSFGAVEIHTVVEQSQIGITVHADRDIARWFSSEVPSLESGLNQSHLNLTGVNFDHGRSGVQTATGFSNGQPRQSFSQTPGSQSSISSGAAAPEQGAGLESTVVDVLPSDLPVGSEGSHVSIHV